MKKLILILSFCGGAVGAVAIHFLADYLGDSSVVHAREVARSIAFSETKNTYPSSVSFRAGSRGTDRIDLSLAAERSKESVVFIRNIREGNDQDPFAWFFGKGRGEQASNGSGVIFSKDGYVVTNHHVIKKADRIEVVHQKRIYEATLVGSDPSTDLAVIKINAQELPPISLGSSSELRIGDWVLAVGNPFNLSSTVTAGIVSAKGRNINLLKDKFPIESFIQTDAAINPGNSGGALVNDEGLLVGINTAILSQTGYYSGYSFAIPVDIARKVVDDLIRYREVQRAFTGMDFLDIDSRLASKIGLSSLNGILIHNIQSEGAAEKAGIKIGDVIIKVNDQPIESKSEIEELIGHAYPGDVLHLNILREGEALYKELTLLNKEGTTEIIKRKRYYLEKWGIELEPISKLEKDLYQIPQGVKILRANARFFRNFPQYFIITHINKRAVRTPKEVESILNNIRGRVLFQGITQDGHRVNMQGNIY